MATRYKTGDIAPNKAWYNWDVYTDGTTTASATAVEKRIPLYTGEKFPPIRSCNKGAYWVYSSSR